MPPVADKLALYGVLALPTGSVEFVIAKTVWETTITVALALELALAVLVAVTVTEALVVTLGATKAPVLEIVPPVVDHVTPVSEVPLICAVN